jgi:serine/threonine-protein kinase
VVLKFLKRDSNEMQRTYFLREARLAGSLTHRNITQILDIDAAEGRLYYVMQHVPGRTLGVVLKDGPLPTGEALHILRDLSAALDHAHGHGILHRDVKPENVLLGDDGVVRLFDFGLARLGSAGFGDQSMVVGTPSHMAPEQIRGGVLDHRTDLYSLGVVAYELLTGHLPFEEGNLFVAHALEPVPDPRKYRPELPAEVTPVLERAMAKQPAVRFSAGAEFLAALGRALQEVQP